MNARDCYWNGTIDNPFLTWIHCGHPVDECSAFAIQVGETRVRHCGHPSGILWTRFVFSIQVGGSDRSLLDGVCPRCSRHVCVVTQLLSKTLGPSGFEKTWWALHLWTSCCCGIRDCPSSKSQSTYFEHVFNLDAQSRYIRLSMPGPLPRHKRYEFSDEPSSHVVSRSCTL